MLASDASLSYAFHQLVNIYEGHICCLGQLTHETVNAKLIWLRWNEASKLLMYPTEGKNMSLLTAKENLRKKNHLPTCIREQMVCHKYFYCWYLLLTDYILNTILLSEMEMGYTRKYFFSYTLVRSYSISLLLGLEENFHHLKWLSFYFWSIVELL